MDALFPPRDYQDRIDSGLGQALATGSEHVNAGAVTPTLDMNAFRQQLARFDFLKSRLLEETLTWTIEQLKQGVVHVTHPRYFGLFNPTPTFPSLCADRVIATFNPQLATATTSPVAVAIEAHMVSTLADRVGLPSTSGGHFTSGGSEANYTAVILALAEACPDFNEGGVRAFAASPVFYVSRDSHLAWVKIARQAGLGQSAVKFVATDSDGRLDPAALREAIQADRQAGQIPFMIAATAGTTNAGMIDPIADIHEVAREFRLWFHVDAAWGGALIACSGRRSVLAGIERADSLTIDAHKWFATTMGCGVFLTAHAEALQRTFRVVASYMPSATLADPYTSSIQWSRRFAGLQLFFSLASAGWEGYAQHIEHTLEMAELLKANISAMGWKILNRSPVGVVCMRPKKPCSVRTLVGHVVASGRAWVSVTQFQGQEVVRACVTSGLTRPHDVATLVAALLDAETHCE